MVVLVVVQLDLHLVLELTVRLQELLIFCWVCEVLLVLGQQMNLTVVRPRVKLISVWVLCPNADVLATS